MSIKRTPNTKEGDTATLETEVLERSPLTPTDAVDESEIKKIEELLADSELAGGSIRLERKGPSDSSYQYCTKIRVADGVDLDLIKRVWGGGDYKAKTFRSNGQMYKSFTFAIDYRIKGSMDMSGMDKAPADNGRDIVQLAQILKGDGGQTNLMVKMMEQASSANQQTMQMMMMMMQQSQQQSAAMMTAMATAMAGKGGGSDISALVPVLTAMINRPIVPGSSQQTNLVELVTAMKELKELAAPGSVPQTEKEEETLFDKLLKYGGPVVAALVTRQPIQMPGAGQPEAAAQLPAPISPPVNALPPEFSAYVNMIIGAAGKNADTGTYADLIADNLDEQQADILCKILQEPDWIQKLAETDRRVLNFVPWFTKLRNELLETYGIAEQPNPVDAPGHASPPAHPEAVSRPAGNAPIIVVPSAPAGGAGAAVG